MKIIPMTVMADIVDYLKLFNLSLSEETEKVLLGAEEYAYKCNNPSNFNLIFSNIVKNSSVLREFLIEKGIVPELVSFLLEKNFYVSVDKLAEYERDSDLYSQQSNRNICDKTAMLDLAMEYCIKDNRNVMEIEDILFGVMDVFERMMTEDGGNWTDKRLNVADATISHIYGCYHKELWIEFNKIREALLNANESGKPKKIA